MPKLYYLSDFDWFRLDGQAEQSALSGERRDGLKRLFDKNRWQTVYVRVVDKSPVRMIYLVELVSIRYQDGREEPLLEVPNYFKNVLREKEHPL